jgi:hypothetical protein
VVLVNGLGGIGKTTLVQVYISKYYDVYEHIAWITQSSENIINDFIIADGLITNLKVETVNKDTEQLFKEIIGNLKAVEEKPNLLIIDNAEQSLKHYKDILPGGHRNWHLLITSREQITGFYPKPLSFLSEKESIELFKKHYTYKMFNEWEIKELVEIVDYHTLTIEILAKTAQVQQYSVDILKQAIEKDLKANIEVARQSAEVEKIGSYLVFVWKRYNSLLAIL